MAVSFQFKDLKYKLRKKRDKKNWITKIIEEESYLLGDISIILTSDNFLLKINKDFLNHNYFTDVITFDYSEENIISGDILISIDRIKENAKDFNCSEENELNRVIIHGILHLIKYNDKTNSEKIEMREKEDYYLKLT